MAAPKTEVISTRVPPRDAQILRSVAALEDVSLSMIASRALRDYTARLTVRSEGARSVMAQSV
jgi:hypothetical protein